MQHHDCKPLRKSESETPFKPILKRISVGENSLIKKHITFNPDLSLNIIDLGSSRKSSMSVEEAKPKRKRSKRNKERVIKV